MFQRADRAMWRLQFIYPAECALLVRLQVLRWVQRCCTAHPMSGQICFDFMLDRDDGDLYCIECEHRPPPPTSEQPPELMLLLLLLPQRPPTPSRVPSYSIMAARNGTWGSQRTSCMSMLRARTSCRRCLIYAEQHLLENCRQPADQHQHPGFPGRPAAASGVLCAADRGGQLRRAADAAAEQPVHLLGLQRAGRLSLWRPPCGEQQRTMCFHLYFIII